MTAGELVLAAVLDALIGDPRRIPHPVRLMGRCIAWCDAFLHERCRGSKGLLLAGIGLAVGLPACVFGVSAGLIGLAQRLDSLLGSVVTVWLASTTLAARDLWDHVRAVERPLLAGDLPAARQAVGMIVGRDTAHLSDSEISRATVETIAESTADGIIAPLFYLALGGVPLALAYKAINTLDSMVGHRDERYIEFGWASARLDDVANWIPARITAGLLLLSAAVIAPRSHHVGRGWRVVQRDGGNHPSPNSGRPEAAMAGLLGVRLGGINFYEGIPEERPLLHPEGRAPEPGDIVAALRLMIMATLLGVAVAAGWTWLI
ncbi:MAG: adenosylcobinamide-phosphate synthase CbiB [Nitrospira sp.]|nr:adenosylcobinamide-phosphate synthase CbiB [Nitrospira sp.]MCP9442609.1 adenosylcobinamide-phosphate synthase CbiB [Nitrospira sp.]